MFDHKLTLTFDKDGDDATMQVVGNPRRFNVNTIRTFTVDEEGGATIALTSGEVLWVGLRADGSAYIDPASKPWSDLPENATPAERGLVDRDTGEPLLPPGMDVEGLTWRRENVATGDGDGYVAEIRGEVIGYAECQDLGEGKGYRWIILEADGEGVGTALPTHGTALLGLLRHKGLLKPKMAPGK